jgi:hypothetical protein
VFSVIAFVVFVGVWHVDKPQASLESVWGLDFFLLKWIISEL